MTKLFAGPSYIVDPFSDVILATESSELSAEDIIDAGSVFLNGLWKETTCKFMSALAYGTWNAIGMALEMPLDADSLCAYLGIACRHHKVY